MIKIRQLPRWSLHLTSYGATVRSAGRVPSFPQGLDATAWEGARVSPPRLRVQALCHSSTAATDGVTLWECPARPPWRMLVPALPGGCGGHNDNGEPDEGTTHRVGRLARLPRWSTHLRNYGETVVCDVVWHDIAVVASVGILMHALRKAHEETDARKGSSP